MLMPTGTYPKVINDDDLILAIRPQINSGERNVTAPHPFPNIFSNSLSSLHIS